VLQESIIYGYDRLPMDPVAPLSPDYVPGPEHPPSPDYVPGPEHPPSPAYVPDLTLSPGYIADSDPEEEEEDPEEDPADYLADGGDEDDDDESSGDDNDDDDVEEDEEEEHLAPANSSVVPIVNHIPSAEDTKAFETDESAPTPPASPPHIIMFSKIRPRTAWMSVRPQTTIPFPHREEVERLLALPTSPPSPLTPLSSPFPIPSPPTTNPTYTEAPLGYRVVGIRLRTTSPPPLPLSLPLPLPPPIILPRTRASMVLMRAVAPSTYILEPRSRTPPSGTPPILPIPSPISSLTLPLTSTYRRADVPEAVLPPQKRLCIALGPRFEVEESSSATAARPTGGFRADYGFVGTLDAEIRCDPYREVGYGITNVWVDPTEAAKEI
ncbi:hypothetical protein Tco_1158552, partial [Tanacetum coccineum]